MIRLATAILILATITPIYGARSAGPELLPEITKGEWVRSIQYDLEGNPTGNFLVGITATAANVGAMKGIEGGEHTATWPDAIVARTLLANACVPPVPANRTRVDVMIAVHQMDFPGTIKRITCRYVEARTPKWR